MPGISFLDIILFGMKRKKEKKLYENYISFFQAFKLRFLYNCNVFTEIKNDNR